MRRSRGKSAPRRKTGCFACRARHVRCDEALPRCGQCEKSSIQCQRNDMIVFAPETPRNEQITKNKSKVDNVDDASETMFLLRHFQDGIAVWMDLFDRGMAFQRLLMHRATQSELLRTRVCALASRQMALTLKTTKWTNAAERLYGNSLRLLLNALAAKMPIALTLPASVLLLSFELMAGMGQDYSRHFHGARSLIEDHIEAIRSTDDQLLMASYWVYVRHDVDIAITYECSMTLEDKFWLPAAGAAEDALGNSMLLLAAKTANYTFGVRITTDATEYLSAFISDELDKWHQRAAQVIQPLVLGSESKSSTRWYPTSSGASAWQVYHSAQLLMQRNGNAKAIDSHAREIIAISQSSVADAAQVQAIHCLFLAAKCSRNKHIKAHVMDILAATEERTGFSTGEKRSTLKRAKAVTPQTTEAYS